MGFISSTLSPAQRRWSTTKRKLYAIVLALKKFRSYIYGRPFKILTNHQIMRPKLSNSVLCGLYLKIPRNSATKLTIQLITLAILKQFQRIIFQNRYIKETNKFSKIPNVAHTLFIKLFTLKAYKNAALMDYNSR